MQAEEFGATRFTMGYEISYRFFTGPDPVTDKVVATGDELDDGFVVGTVFGFLRGLNDFDQVAFAATSADGSTVRVYRADPWIP